MADNVYIVVRHTAPGDQFTVGVYLDKEQANTRRDQENERDGPGYKNVSIETWPADGGPEIE